MIIVRTMQDVEKYFKAVFKGIEEESLLHNFTNYVVYNDADNPKELVKQILKILPGDLDNKAVADFCECVFQLNDYQHTLKNFVEFLLAGHYFEALCAFVSKIFVPSVGGVQYKSKGEYSFEERYFDRFAEIAEYCKIDYDMLLPFFLNIMGSSPQSPLHIYKEPLKEYLKIFAKHKQDDFFKYFSVGKNLDGIDYFLSIDAPRTLSMLIDAFVTGENNQAPEIRNIIAEHKTESFDILSNRINTDDPNILYRVVILLAALKGSFEADNILLSVYNNTKNGRIKTFIEKELELAKFSMFESEAKFLDFVNNNITAMQERLYGIRLKRYFKDFNLNSTEQEGKIISFIIETFKNSENDSVLRFMKDYFKFVPEELKNNLAGLVFKISDERGRLYKSKWAIRLISCFAGEALIGVIKKLICNLYKNGQAKTAEYFILCLTLSNNPHVIDVINYVAGSNPTKKQLKYFDKMLNALAAINNVSIEEILDECVKDYGLDDNAERIFNLGRRKLKVYINEVCNMSVVNVKTAKPARLNKDISCGDINLKEYVKELKNEILKQQKRFYNTFLECRAYTKQNFNRYILESNIMSAIAGFLLWGKYKNGRLYEIFRVVNHSMEHISGPAVPFSDDYYVQLVHPLDINSEKERLRDIASSVVFNQLDFPKFSFKDSNASWVDSFNGLFVNAGLFITRLQKLSYKINDLGRDNFYSTLVKASRDTNLLTEVVFDKVQLREEKKYTTVVSKIGFYKLDTLLKNGKNYMLSPSKSLTLKNIDERILSNELALVYLACSK